MSDSDNAMNVDTHSNIPSAPSQEVRDLTPAPFPTPTPTSALTTPTLPKVVSFGLSMDMVREMYTALLDDGTMWVLPLQMDCNAISRTSDKWFQLPPVPTTIK
jgi:hypothetical protein